jgi:hypothetical protein
MKIPESVRINGIDYAVELREKLDNGQNVLYGWMSFGSETIALNTTVQHHQMQCVTLWHEMFHIALYMYDIDLGEQEERALNALAHATYQILHDNGNKLFDLRDPIAGGGG